MRIVITAEGSDLESAASQIFGRCPVLLFVDVESGHLQPVPNPAATASGGAGVQAARLVVDRGAQAVITGRVGPKAAQVLDAAGVALHRTQGARAGEVLEHYLAGQLEPLAVSQP